MKRQTHYLERQIPYDDITLRGILSVAPSRKIVVFVHGYGGDGVSTWADFDRLSIRRPEFSGYDILFYEYDGLQAELRASSSLFYEFLTWLFGYPAHAINQSLSRAAARPTSFSYDKVILVCHSLGAVIARFALLRATREQKVWAPKAKLLLFAPAHKGAVVTKLALETAGHFRFLALFAGILEFKSPLVKQLEKGSAELIELESHTMAELNGGANNHLMAHKVCIAEKEHVVSNDKFGIDPEAEAIRHATHTTICKPKQPRFGEPFLKPLDALIWSLK
jgi:pimeloyl-ACP methyl ester carboxylesterase